MSDAIARHLQQNQDTPTAPETEPQKTAQQIFQRTSSGEWLFQQVYQQQHHAQDSGSQLNQMDREMTSGLEHLLPSAPTRYGLTCRRLEEEISAIKAKLHDYEALLATTPRNPMEAQNRGELKEAIHALKSRLMVLERHYYKASMALSRIEQQKHPVQFAVKQPLHMVQDAMKQWWDEQNPGDILKSDLQKRVDASYQQLQYAKALLEAENGKPLPSPEAISNLVHQYERALKNYQALLKERKPNLLFKVFGIKTT